MALKIAVAGLGPRGQTWVREVQAAGAYHLAACVDSDPAVVRQAQDQLGLPAALCFSALEDALAHSECDAVLVATSLDSHVQPCAAALSRGLGVLVEKPFTTSLTEARQLVELAEAKGAPIVVAQNYRTMRAYRTMRRVLRSGVLGRVGMFSAHYYHVPHEMAASLVRQPYSVLWGMAIHHFDGLRYVLGQRARGIMAQSFTQPWGRLPHGASMQLLLNFDGGAHGLYSATYESSGHEYFGRGQEFYIRFTGERATLHVLHRWLFLCERGKLPRIVFRGRRGASDEARLLRQLERALLHGEAAQSSGRDNLQTMAMAEAFIRSATERRWIDPQDLLHE